MSSDFLDLGFLTSKTRTGGCPIQARFWLVWGFTMTSRALDSETSHPPHRDKLSLDLCMAQIQRRKSYTAIVGGVRVGSDAPIVVQSMTNTDTADIDGTIRQCMALARAGSEL